MSSDFLFERLTPIEDQVRANASKLAYVILINRTETERLGCFDVSDVLHYLDQQTHTGDWAADLGERPRGSVERNEQGYARSDDGAKSRPAQCGMREEHAIVPDLSALR